MTYPTRKQIAAMLKPWAQRHAAIEAAFAPLLNGGYMSVDSPLFDATWLTFEAYTEALGQLVGDEFKWLQWFAETMPDNHYDASPRKGVPLRKIRNLSDLAWLIVESRA